MTNKKHIQRKADWKNLVVSAFLSIPITLASYFWLIQPTNFISKRYLAATILVWLVLAVGIFYFLGEFRKRNTSIDRKKFYLSIILSVITASLFGIFTVGIENTPYNLFTLPTHTLVIENANEIDSDQIELLYFNSGLDDESLSKFIIDGNWARTGNSLTVQGTQKATLIFEGWLVENPALSFRAQPNGGQVNIYWDGQLEQVSLSSSQTFEKHFTKINPINIPISNQLPVVISGILTIAILVFPLFLQLVKIDFAATKELVGRETASHFQLLSIKKKDVRAYFSSPYRIILMILFAVLFLPHAFVVVEDINLVTAYEVDPGSIIKSMIRLYQPGLIYNMNETTHARYYGWTYFSINFFLLIPVYALTALKILPNDTCLFVSIRLIFFFIGLVSMLAFYEVAKRTLKNNLLSFTAALLYFLSPTVFMFFYFLHPETTGLLFLFLSILCLIRFNEGKSEDYRWYTFGLLSLVLSTLSKHVFLLTSLPVLFLFVYFYCRHHKTLILRFFISKKFARILIATICSSVFIFFIINPAAFIKPTRFLTNQKNLFFSHAGGAATLSRMEAIQAWIEIVKTEPMIFYSILTSPLAVLGTIIFGRNHKTGGALYLVNILSAVSFIIIMSYTSRFIIYAAYFAPVYPFFVLNILSIPLFITKKWDTKPIQLITSTVLIYFLLRTLLGYLSISLPIGYARLRYQDSVIYKTYEYIEKHIPAGSKISYDAFVAVPSDKKVTSCLFWDKCAEDIEEFQPDYVLFNEEYTFNGVYAPTVRLIDYVTDNQYKRIDTIEIVSVWKKPHN